MSINATSSINHYVNQGKAVRLYAQCKIARVEAQKINTTLRIDVVEISKNARLYMENQARLSQIYPPLL